MFYRNSRNDRGYPIRKGFFFLLVMIGGALLLGAAVMALWNAILPDLLGAGRLTFVKAIGLLVLCRLLFGGWGGRFRRHNSYGHSGKVHWREKWRNMSEEEREKFKEAWKERCRKRDGQ